MSKIIRLLDRTRTVADWRCPRARYWGYEYGGRGIVRSSTNLELALGIVIHDALATLGHLTLAEQPIDIDEIARLAFKQTYDQLAQPEEGVVTIEADTFAKEQGTLVEGLIRGFYKHVWPKLLEGKRIVCLEEEMEYPLGSTGKADFTFMTKPDLLLDDSEGNITYVEYKSTSSKKENWVNSWETAVQLHSSVKAVEQCLGRTVDHVQIVGLYKGYESYGKQSSPMCYAYKKAGHPPFTQDAIQYEYKAGFKRVPTWELDGGVKQWIADMPDTVLADQFPMTAPIYVNDDLINRFFEQRLVREGAILDATGRDTDIDVMNEVFPQRFDQCTPSFGHGCAYKKLCHGYFADPLEEGYVWREPHHEQEREQLGLDKSEDEA